MIARTTAPTLPNSDGRVTRVAHRAARGEPDEPRRAEDDAGHGGRDADRESDVHQRDDRQDCEVHQRIRDHADAVDFLREHFRVVRNAAAAEKDPARPGNRLVQARTQLRDELPLEECADNRLPPLDQALHRNQDDVHDQHDTEGRLEAHGTERRAEPRHDAAQIALPRVHADQLQQRHQHQQSDTFGGAQREQQDHRLGGVARGCRDQSRAETAQQTESVRGLIRHSVANLYRPCVLASHDPVLKSRHYDRTRTVLFSSNPGGPKLEFSYAIVRNE